MDIGYMTGRGEKSAAFKQKAALSDVVVTFLCAAVLTEVGPLDWILGDQRSVPASTTDHCVLG